MLKYILIWLATILTILGLNVFDILKIINLHWYNIYLQNEKITNQIIVITAMSLSIIFAITDKITAKREKEEKEKSDENTRNCIQKSKKEIIEEIKKSNFPESIKEGLQWTIEGIQYTDDLEVLELIKKITYFYKDGNYKKHY